MKCNCKACEIVLAAIILVLTLWPEIFSAVASKWIIVIAAIVLIIHSLGCKSRDVCEAQPAKKKSKRK